MRDSYVYPWDFVLIHKFCGLSPPAARQCCDILNAIADTIVVEYCVAYEIQLYPLFHIENRSIENKT